MAKLLAIASSPRGACDRTTPLLNIFQEYLKMIFYTGNYTFGCHYNQKHNVDLMGVLITPQTISKNKLEGLPFALDNGAWTAFKNNRTYQPADLIAAAEYLTSKELIPDFVVVPDFVEDAENTTVFFSY